MSSSPMALARHPFDVVPYAGPALRPVGAAQLQGELSEHELALVRGLRPETLARCLLTGGSALFSVLLYSGLWGTTIACGLVLGMWAHEVAHRAVLQRLGLEVSPIVFVPFVGATQRIRSLPTTLTDAALIALAGPLAGLIFAATCKLAYTATGHRDLRFLGTAHALLSLVDLIPLGPLDGRRIFDAVSRRQRIACLCATAMLALLCQSLLVTPLCAALAWSATRPAPQSHDRRIAVVFVALVATGLLLV